MRDYLGLSLLAWAFLAWGGIAGTFAVASIYRLLIAHRPQHETFMRPAEVRRTLDHLRNVSRVVIAFGVATAAALVLIGAAGVGVAVNTSC